MVKTVCFYLPQYHPCPENDEWWGKGFTEWRNVARARPNFEHHYQPHVPADLGYYDLRTPEVMTEQVALADKYGIHGFCFYYYWFNGRRVLEMPLNQFFRRKELNKKFCVCWANENWTRTWDGDDKHVLLGQNHNLNDDRDFIRSLFPLFKDKRYIRVNNKPMLLIYKADRPFMKEACALWRREALDAGFPGLHLCVVQFSNCYDPTPYGFDAAVEFPPHNYLGSLSVPDEVPALSNPSFSGGILDYRKVIAQSLAKKSADFTWYRGVMPSWDNTARR